MKEGGYTEHKQRVDRCTSMVQSSSRNRMKSPFQSESEYKERLDSIFIRSLMSSCPPMWSVPPARSLFSKRLSQMSAFSCAVKAGFTSLSNLRKVRGERLALGDRVVELDGFRRDEIVLNFELWPAFSEEVVIMASEDFR